MDNVPGIYAFNKAFTDKHLAENTVPYADGTVVRKAFWIFSKGSGKGRSMAVCAKDIEVAMQKRNERMCVIEIEGEQL